MRIDLSGRTALVTGAGHGFGRAIAMALSEVGAVVVACDINDEGLAATVAGAGPLCSGQHLDVTDEDAISAMVAALGAEGRAIDILVNNAGGVRGQSAGRWRL